MFFQVDWIIYLFVFKYDILGVKKPQSPFPLHGSSGAIMLTFTWVGGRTGIGWCRIWTDHC